MIIKTTGSLQVSGSAQDTILDSVLNAGHYLEYSCKNGQCGMCKTMLLAGEVIELHPQIALSKEEIANNQILTCCCAPKTDIQIDAEELSALQGIEVKTFPARINKLVNHEGKVVEVELRLPPSAEFNFLEGQFIDVIGEGGVKRSYSIANSSKENVIQLMIKKLDGGVLSQYWFHEARENDLLRIEGPKGTFYLRNGNAKTVFLATGTGIAPVKAILDKLNENQDAGNGKTIYLCWGNRDPEDFFWTPDYPNLNVHYLPVLSKENPGWSGKTGYVQDVLIEEKLDLRGAQVYACGSMQMIKSAHKVLVENGLDDKQFYSDAFVSS